MGKGETAARALDISGAGALLRRWGGLRPGVLILNYHRIVEEDGDLLDRGLWSATPASFDAQMQLLADECDVILPSEIEDRLGVRRRAVVITFDDGYSDSVSHALPILQSHGLRAAYFLTTGFLDRTAAAWWDEIAWMVQSSPKAIVSAAPWLNEDVRLEASGGDDATALLVACYKTLPWHEREPFLDHLADAAATGRRPPGDRDHDWMTWDDARRLAAAGMVIGAHTVTHPILAGMPHDLQRGEIETSISRIEEELGRRPALFSYPVGARNSFDASTRNELGNCGVRLAFSNYGGVARRSAWDPWDVPRANVWRDITPAWFRALVAAPAIFARW